MPGVLVKYALVMELTQHGPFLSVEDLVARFDDRKKKRPTPRTTQLSLFVPSPFGNSGLTKDSK